MLLTSDPSSFPFTAFFFTGSCFTKQVPDSKQGISQCIQRVVVLFYYCVLAPCLGFWVPKVGEELPDQVDAGPMNKKTASITREQILHELDAVRHAVVSAFDIGNAFLPQFENQCCCRGVEEYHFGTIAANEC
ncbi:hypothetical protein P4V54_20235 [Brevibacillus nitrificans]|nr:hypothetical protein [Brevibacillus nitrificans]